MEDPNDAQTANNVEESNDDTVENKNGHNFDDDDEEECRVCRGPAEEGHPLFKPCQCSGSIGLTHQDCLQSWLKVQRRDGSCELCKTTFRFAPQYAENTPDRLRPGQVIVSLCRRALARWLPLTIRSLFAASLWLLLAPLVTSYLYHGWMARPSAVFERFKWNLIVIDLISGAVVTACIIISFLSLMSFADFLRVEWQQRGLVPRLRGADRENERNNHAENERNLIREGDVDNGLWEHVQNQVLQQPNRVSNPRLRQLVALERELNDIADNNNNSNASSGDQASMGSNADAPEDSDESWEENEMDRSDDDDDVDDDENQNQDDNSHNQNQVDGIANDDDEPNAQHAAEQQNEERRPVIERLVPPPPPPEIRAPQAQNRPRNDIPPDIDPDEAIDLDINIALDELLGVRGPLMVVGRNLLWLLAFNAVFLGFFAFLPRTFGVAVSSFVLNTTLFSSPDLPENMTEDIMTYYNISEYFSLSNTWKAIEAESIHQNTTLRLNDIATVALGYLSIAAIIILLRCLWLLSQKIRLIRNNRERTGNPDIDDMRDAIDEMNRLVHGLANEIPNLGEDPPVLALSLAVDVALDALVAIVKVGILLFLKMFLLPIVLGLTLDASTILLFGSTVEQRIAYAGRDLFSFILLHWVAGITFMLLVTVSVLQLREVAHPDLLSQVIRPQEPQPDLLGNLMHESVSTHAKRMILSLIIYAFLLSIHVYIPVRLYGALFGTNVPFLKPKLSYILTPQLQVPLELLIFHLCMLALLEKYKNGLGGIQHHWLKFMADILGLSDRILPQNVENFRYLGYRAVFESGSTTVDNFWFDLSKTEGDPIALLDSSIDTFRHPGKEVIRIGETKENGERVLQIGSDFIKLPIRLPGRAFRARSTLLPAKIGKFRLKRETIDDSHQVIQLWEEVPGKPVNRPPEGWDDLGAGGADVQGRWAWGNEKKSTIEGGIAARRRFFGGQQSALENSLVFAKILVLAMLSWFAATLVVCTFLSTPLFVGRSLYYIFRIPESWIHDPLAFGVGFILVFPTARKIAKAFVNSDVSFRQRCFIWLTSFRFPSAPKTVILIKAAVLWFGVAPLLLGFVYEVAFIKSADWFSGKEDFLDRKTATLSWILGSVLLYAWADLCIVGVFTRNFRLFGEPREAAADDNLANAEAAAWYDIGGGRVRLSWQGKHGRMARFFDAWKAAMMHWEWDKVDEVILVQDCATPVVTELFWCLFIPLGSLYAICWNIPLVSGLARKIFARSIMMLFVSIEVGRVWRDQLQHWFEAAHKTARDDRYLIGEVLLNYGE